MIRKKLQIVTLIADCQDGYLDRIQTQATEWSDIIHVVAATSLVETWDDINRTMDAESVRVVGLRSSWVISDPHIVRDVIERNYKRVVRARRYFMEGSQYYSDGWFGPGHIIFSYQLMPTNLWLNHLPGVAPAQTWKRDFVTAPFDVLDFATEGLGAKGTLRDYEDVIPV